MQQFVQEGHLRWDSLGEFLALSVSLEDLAYKTNNDRAQILAEALNRATAQFLIARKSPSRVVHELDNRGSHFYLALFWAQALAEQDGDAALQEQFAKLAEQMAASEAAIIDELNAAQGSAIDIGGYYHPDREKTVATMRPSGTLNAILQGN